MKIASEHYQGVAAHHDKLAKYGFYGLLAPRNRGGRKSEYVTILFDEAVVPLIREKCVSSLLDFGCGTGVLCHRVAHDVDHVTGMDIAAGALQVAKESCGSLPNVTLTLIDGDYLPCPDAHFDCVVAREALMYVPDSKLEHIVAEIYRVLRPGGSFVLLDQVSNDPYWQKFSRTPLQLKRSPVSFRDCASHVGFVLEREYTVRTPRFPTVYLAWFGLIPPAFIPKLVRFEIAWHRRRSQPRTRWWNELFLFVKSP